LVFYAWLFGCLSHSGQHRALVFPNASHFKHCHALLCDRLICITCLSTIHLDGKLERSLVSLFSFLYVLLFSSILTDLYRSIKALVDPAIWGGEWRQGIIDWKKRWHYLVYRTISEQISSHIMMLPVQIWMELLVNLHCHKQSQTITKGLFASIGFNPVGIIDSIRSDHNFLATFINSGRNQSSGNEWGLNSHLLCRPQLSQEKSKVSFTKLFLEESLVGIMVFRYK
jgi:hypothetical protein